MKAKLESTRRITLTAETLEDGVLIERPRRKFIGGSDPAWPQGIPAGGLSSDELILWYRAQIKAGRNPLLLSWPLEI